MPWMRWSAKGSDRGGARKPHGTDPRYNSKTWRRYRHAYLMTHPTCVICGEVAEVVDHIRPMRLTIGVDFYDQSNHQSMCHACHNAKRGRESHQSVQFNRVHNGRKR